MFETFLHVFAGCSRLGQTAALQCIKLWELQPWAGAGGDGSGEAWPGCLVGTETSAISPAWILQRGGSITSAVIGYTGTF